MPVFWIYMRLKDEIFLIIWAGFSMNRGYKEFLRAFRDCLLFDCSCLIIQFTHGCRLFIGVACRYHYTGIKKIFLYFVHHFVSFQSILICWVELYRAFSLSSKDFSKHLATFKNFIEKKNSLKIKLHLTLYGFNSFQYTGKNNSQVFYREILQLLYGKCHFLKLNDKIL